MLKKGGGFSFAFSVPLSSSACQYGLGCRKKKFSSPFFRSLPSAISRKPKPPLSLSTSTSPPPKKKSGSGRGWWDRLRRDIKYLSPQVSVICVRVFRWS